MKRKKNLTILAIAFLLVASLVSASLDRIGTFKKGERIDLLQVCATCTYNNITSVTAPNSTLILSAVAMDRIGSKFNYTLQAQNVAGIYNVCGVGDLEGDDTAWCYTFEITQTGYKPTTAQSIIYFVLLAISMVCFILFLALGFSMSKDRYNKDSISGRIIEVNWKKYYRMGCWFIAYALAVWMAHLSHSISENFLDSSTLSTFFNMIFYILLALALPFTTFFVFIFFASIVTDKKAQRLLERGLQP